MWLEWVCFIEKYHVAVASNSRSRMFVTVVNMCSLVNGGQHLFFCTSAAGWCFCFVFRVRAGVEAISTGVSIFFAR